MSTEPATTERLALLVVAFVGIMAVEGLSGLIYLIHSGADASALLAVSTPTATAVGILGGILINSRTQPPRADEQLRAEGYQQASDDVRTMAGVTT